MDPVPLIQELLKNVDLAVVTALGVILTLAFTQIVKALANCETFFGWRNPTYRMNADGWMSVVALLFGGAYGWATGNAPGHFDNFRSGILYGAAAIVVFKLLKKWMPLQTNGKPQE